MENCDSHGQSLRSEYIAEDADAYGPFYSLVEING